MSQQYHDASVNLEVIVSVESESHADAQTKIEQLSKVDLVKLIIKQMPFIDDRFDQTTAH